MESHKAHNIIIIDTNFLLIPGQFGVDIFEEIKRLLPGYDLVVMDKTNDELDRILLMGSQKDKTAAKIACKMLSTHKFDYISSGKGHVDDLIVSYIKQESEKGNNMFIATQDRDLRRRAKPYAGLLVMRQKTHLEIIG
jgi:uncharacterized protein